MAEGFARAGQETVFLALGQEESDQTHPELPELRLCQVRLLRGYMRATPLRQALRHRIARALGAERFDLIVFTNPVQPWLLPKSVRNCPWVYDCMDLLPEFYTGRVRQSVTAWERELCGRCDALVCSSAPIRDHALTEYGVSSGQASVIRNGYDPDEVGSIAAKTLQHPNLVYIGTLDHRWLDLDALRKFAVRCLAFTVYLVGPATDEARRGWTGNVVFTGPLEHRQALSYAAGADVTCMPFVLNTLIQGVDPVKLYEYIGLGKPVVTERWAALDPFTVYPNLKFYSSPDEFEEQVLAAAGGGRYPVPPSFRDTCSWWSRVEEMLAVCGEVLQHQG